MIQTLLILFTAVMLTVSVCHDPVIATSPSVVVTMSAAWALAGASVTLDYAAWRVRSDSSSGLHRRPTRSRP